MWVVCCISRYIRNTPIFKGECMLHRTIFALWYPIRRHLIVATISLLSMVVFVAGQAPAVMLSSSVGELTRRSAAVVTGQVTDKVSSWTADRQSIITTITIAVDEVVTGQAVKEIKVVVEGGEVDGMGLYVSDQPSFAVDERVLVFAGTSYRAAQFNAYEVVGWAQGKYSISEDGLAVRSGFSLAGPGTPEQDSLDLNELIAKIKQAKGGE